jgi:hypothetical protein
VETETGECRVTELPTLEMSLKDGLLIVWPAARKPRGLGPDCCPEHDTLRHCRRDLITARCRGCRKGSEGQDLEAGRSMRGPATDDICTKCVL